MLESPRASPTPVLGVPWLPEEPLSHKAQLHSIPQITCSPASDPGGTPVPLSLGCEQRRPRLGMEALEGEADKTSPEREPMGSVVLPMATAHFLGLL